MNEAREQGKSTGNGRVLPTLGLLRDVRRGRELMEANFTGAGINIAAGIEEFSEGLNEKIGDYLERGRRYGDLTLPDLSRRFCEAVVVAEQQCGDLVAEQFLRSGPEPVYQGFVMYHWLKRQGRRRIKKWASGQSGRVTREAEDAIIETIFNFFNTKEDAKQALPDVLDWVGAWLRAHPGIVIDDVEALEVEIAGGAELCELNAENPRHQGTRC
jgi:hypothetical protein